MWYPGRYSLLRLEWDSRRGCYCCCKDACSPDRHGVNAGSWGTIGKKYQEVNRQIPSLNVLSYALGHLSSVL